MTRSIHTSIEVEVIIRISDDAPYDVITRCFTEDWRGMFYDLPDEEEVIEHWAYNAASNGVTDVSHLEGWADVPSGMVTMY